MEVDEIQTQACKFSRIGNKIAQIGDQYPEDDDDGELKNGGAGAGAGVGGGGGGGGDDAGGRFRGWHSSRIFRVSRASGGKDRHSKVLTSKGLRDRRVRLSVTTAIQFYDLQDRLGYDQPSRAVEWLIKAAASAIAELPPLNNSFPDTPKQASDEKRLRLATEPRLDSADVDLETDHNYHLHHNHVSMSKSACSTSTSETSKGSGLSLSRSEIRVKARERARERAAKEKENDSLINNKHNNVSPISQTSTFTELLTGGIGNVGNNSTSPTGSSQHNHGGEASLFHKSSTRQWSSAPMDYFTSAALLGRTHHSSTYPNLGNSPLPQSMSVLPFSIAGDHFPFGSETDYISSSLAGFNRGTLQSNSPSMFPHLQRFSPIDGSNISNIPFLIGTAATSSPAPLENHHQFPAGFDARLQLCYGDGSSRHHPDQKGKGKN